MIPIINTTSLQSSPITPSPCHSSSTAVNLRHNCPTTATNVRSAATIVRQWSHNTFPQSNKYIYFTRKIWTFTTILLPNYITIISTQIFASKQKLLKDTGCARATVREIQKKLLVVFSFIILNFWCSFQSLRNFDGVDRFDDTTLR
jgi:hypothetical protein